MKRTRLPAAFAGILSFSLLFSACGRHRLRPEEIERNRLWATILEREDRRVVGDDDFLRNNLSDSPYPDIRQRCALALARIGNPRALPWLYAAFRSPYAAVRAVAAFSVGAIEDRELLQEEFRRPDPRAITELAGLLDDPSLKVRLRAIEALGKAGTRDDARIVAAQVGGFSCNGSPLDRTFVETSITAMMRLNDPVAYPVLEKLACGDDPEIQWRAADALASMGAEAARPFFLRLLESPDAKVRASAIRGLGICGDPSLAPRIEPLLPVREARTKRPLALEVRVNALRALGLWKNAASLPAIQYALESSAITEGNPDQWNFAVEAAEAIGNIGAPEGTMVLQPLLKLARPVADSAVVALAVILNKDPERFFDLAGRCHLSASVEPQSWARALGALGGPRAILELKRMLVRSADENASVRETQAIPAVLEALSRTNAADLQSILRPFMDSHEGRIVRAAVQTFRPEPGASAPWEPVLRAYARIAPGTDLEAKLFLLNRLDPWAREREVEVALRRALQDRLRGVRVAAARMLRASGATEVPEEPGPSESRTTRGVYTILAGSREDRTTAILDTTRGRIEIELFREAAPLTVADFVALAKGGHFDGLPLVRVNPRLVMQADNPQGRATENQGDSMRHEIHMRTFESGSVGMTVPGKDAEGNRFFIVTSPQPHLDGRRTCFGRVISGLPAVERMTSGDRINKILIDEDVTFFDYRRY
jgi:peptidyl-prolyl cis-trans isomerase B (cyclophilin B)